MHNATTTPIDGRIVMPDSEEQCKLLYRPEELVPLGDFGRSAGYGVPVLMTADVCRHIIGSRDGLSPTELADRLVESLAGIHEAGSARAAFDAFSIELGSGDEAIELLVRQHLLAAEPYTLISRHEG